MASVTYRLHPDTTNSLAGAQFNLPGEAVPTAPFPAQIQDVRTAIQWLRMNGRNVRRGMGVFNPEKIGAFGDSSGGHLVALLGVTNASSEWAHQGNYAGIPGTIQAVGDYYGHGSLRGYIAATVGGTDLSVLSSQPGFPLNSLLGPFDSSNSRDLAYFELADPLAQLMRWKRNIPPFYIIHGTDDTWVPPSVSQWFFQGLQSLGIPSTFFLAPGAGHVDGVIINSSTYQYNIGQFFKGALR